MAPGFLNPEGGRQRDAPVSPASCKLDGELNVSKSELRVGELSQTKSTDLFRYTSALADKGKPAGVAFKGMRVLLIGGFRDARWKPEAAPHRWLAAGHRGEWGLHRDLGRRVKALQNGIRSLD